MGTTTGENKVSVGKKGRRPPHRARSANLRGAPILREGAADQLTLDPQLAEIERTFTVRYEW